jgi:hypothetical protein
MGILLIDRTINQPRAVHSGHGGKSIAQGWCSQQGTPRGMNIAFTRQATLQQAQFSTPRSGRGALPGGVSDAGP